MIVRLSRFWSYSPASENLRLQKSRLDEARRSSTATRKRPRRVRIRLDCHSATPPRLFTRGGLTIFDRVFLYSLFLFSFSFHSFFSPRPALLFCTCSAGPKPGPAYSINSPKNLLIWEKSSWPPSGTTASFHLESQEEIRTERQMKEKKKGVRPGKVKSEKESRIPPSPFFQFFPCGPG